jgi:hypothetical protein
MRKTTLLLLLTFCTFIFASNPATASNIDSDSSIQIIRLNYTAPNSASRELLLAFTSDNAATDGVDYGYDATVSSPFTNDLNWLIEDNRYVIQGVGAFDNNKQYLFGLYNEFSGEATIEITSLEDFDTDIDIYIYDALLNTYTSVKDTAYTVTLDAENYTDRFYIAFNQPEEDTTDDTTDDANDETTADDDTTTDEDSTSDEESDDATSEEDTTENTEDTTTDLGLKIRYIKGLNQLKISVKNNNTINSVIVYNNKGAVLKTKQNINAKKTNVRLNRRNKRLILHITTNTKTIIKQIVLPGRN